MKGRKSYQFQSLFRFVILLSILVLINIVSASYNERFDLTKEKRYSLAPSTKALLRNLDDVIYVKVYLEGDFPAGFKRLRNSTKELLDEFKAYSRNSIEYVFINPSEGKTTEEKNEFYQELYEKGLQPTNLKVQGDEQLSQKIIFPGAVFTYRDQELPLQLLENQIGFGPQQVLNNSVELMEYKMANVIKKLTQRRKPLILFTEGQGELSNTSMSDIATTLSKLQYETGRIDLSKSLIPKRTSLLVVAKPTLPFREQEKFKIDQFIMNGGSVLWLIDRMNADMDSLRGKDVYFSNGFDLNLDDQLFKYGVRVNADLVQDLQCNQIPLVVGYMGDAPQTELFPWFYYPVVTSNNEHAIVRNLDAISFQFAGTLDTVGKSNPDFQVKKTFLLHSSPYSKALLPPVRLHFSMLKEPPDQKTFSQKNLPLAVLMEGKFESVFKNRLVPSFQGGLDSINQTFKNESDYAKMIVVADGDVIKNDFNSSGEPFPLGYYKFTEQTFANSDFMLNCIEYLADDERLIETRNKEIKLRLLDTTRIKKEKTQWQIINAGMPVALIVIFGLVFNYFRKRKYSR